MRALRCEDTSSLDSLTIREIDDPVPGAREVLVEMKAASVDFVDTVIARGMYQVPIPVPFTPGHNLSGVVRGVGSGCSRFRVGDRVHGMAGGTFAELVAVDEVLLRPTPAGLGHDLACLTGSTYRTAYDALVSVARVQPDEDVVILGASGAVGSAAILIATALGARVIACASTAAKLEHCRELGASETIAYTEPGLKDAIKQLCQGGSADVVLDTVGGDYSEPALRATGFGGRFVVIGFAAGSVPRVPLNLVLLKGSTITGYEIADFERRRSDEAAVNRTALETMLVDGHIQPRIIGRYPLERAHEAMIAVAGRDKFGSTILERE